MKTGIELIAEERERQISREGWTEANDDGHTYREMARAAEAYLNHYVSRSWLFEAYSHGAATEDYQSEKIPDQWPDEWTENWWKPKSPMRDLIRAGALIAAEIDRLQRLESRSAE